MIGYAMNSNTTSITFIHPSNKVVKSALEPIAEEARRRGYVVNSSSDTSAQTEIGVYNTHAVSMDDLKAGKTVGMVNSVDDGYDPSYFWDERWSRFDVGLLIGEAVAEQWQSVTWNRYVHPTEGVYTVGWPKSDRVYTEAFEDELKATRDALDLADGPTAVYAPAEESEGKMFDFLRAADGVVANMIIKHKENLDYAKVREEDYESNLVILDNKADIFVGLGLGDLLVTEKSGVYLDALHVDTVPVSVTDWPINLRVGRHFPDDTLPTFIERTTRAELRSTIDAVCGGEIQRDFDALRQRHFANLGRSAEATMDVIESILMNGDAHLSRVELNQDTMDTPLHERMYIYSKIYAKSRLSAKQKNRLMDLGAGRMLMKLDDILLRGE